MFDKYIRKSRTSRYNLICSIDAHEKQQTSCVDDGIICIGNAIPPNYTTEAFD